ncbi:MIF4G domain-containing protein [Aspergillus chevalieri]|uniref:Suppressor of glycerol defect n=1 Tax=Aspergillus chevalieri TaxID=182096 RepID=A0A7R7VNH2_ASPCH|nr:suppressor of glycerol defect [Aspergillus chevalieri]BCR87912.1 suppressor of glycerol defect [Aspergillus chevalieri]
MKRPMKLTTALPRELRAELGIRDTYGEKKNRRNGPASRKERRREERSAGRKPQVQQRPAWEKNAMRYEEEDDEDEDENMLDEGDESDETPPAKSKSKATKPEQKQPKSILKKNKPVEQSDGSDDDEDNINLDEDEDEDEPAPRKVSKAVQDQLDEDDAEIAALEKRLGLKKGKKLPQSFQDDGLDDLLGDLGDGSEDEGKKRKREADEWLQSKRRKAQGLQQAEPEGDDDEDDSDLASDEEADLLDDDDDGEMDDDAAEGEDSEFDGFDEEEEKPAPKKKENPYVAPVPQESQPAKYIPPSLRAASNSEDESLIRLRRQAQGQLNKLSEANLISILAEFEKLYREYPRQNVTSTIISLLMGLICERSALQDTFMILHAGFIAALYKVMGMDFGAELVQKIVQTLDSQGDERGKFEGKEHLNLISLISQLYNFHVIGHALVFDYIRIYVQDITEDNTELLLKIIRNSGPQLRQDDPSSLKDIVLLIQPAIAKAGEQSLSVRTKFMIDTITDLKNNKVKTVGSSISTEHITKMRKILGSLNNTRVIRASEPINISREDIHNSAKKGKWWLVGASWREDPLETARKELSSLPGAQTTQTQVQEDEDESEAEPDLASIAKSHRMNTDVRRSIFVAIMSATDFQDAHVRLLKLRLKRAQEYEIPRVLTHCIMEEDAYNPYYTLIARRVCGDLGRRLKISFMYTLWNILRRMGEKGDFDDEDGMSDDEGDESTQLPLKSIVNIAKMYGSLIADNTLTLSILKTLNFAYLQSKAKTFVELLIISIIQQSQKSKRNKNTESKSKKEDDEGRDEKALMDIFMRVQDTPQIVKGLIYFIRKVVAKTDIVPEKELKVVKWGCRVALDALKVISSKDGVVG